VGVAILLSRSLGYGSSTLTIGIGVYGLSLVSAFAASTLYHAVTAPRPKHVLLWLDHSCVYALIAGTYTPFMVGILKGATGAAMLCTVWGLAVVGIVAKTVLKIRSERFSIPFYLGMGWLSLLVVRPLASHLGAGGMLLLVAGGLAFSIGVVFFLVQRAYAHAVWHGCVLAGTALHFTCVLLYLLPA
jgi:hemolysin III